MRPRYDHAPNPEGLSELRAFLAHRAAGTTTAPRSRPRLASVPAQRDDDEPD